MVHATWGDWFVREEVEAADPDGLSVWYLGCNGFVVRSPETTLYVDPYFGDGDPPNVVRMIPVPVDPAAATDCDAVLVTHGHVDHLHPPSYGPLLEGTDADLYATAGAYDSPQYDGDLRVSAGERNVVADGDELAFGDLTVHVRGANDPDAVEPVSYVIEHESGTFFTPGDSRPTDRFAGIGREFDIDLGSLAFGSVGRIRYPEDGETRVTRWYQDENDVVEAANALGLERLLPVHYDTWKGVGADPKVLFEHVASFHHPRVVDVVEVGDRVDVDRPGVVPMRSLDPQS